MIVRTHSSVYDIVLCVLVVIVPIIHEYNRLVKPLNPCEKISENFSNKKILNPLSTVVIYARRDPLSSVANTAEKRGGSFSYNIS